MSAKIRGALATNYIPGDPKFHEQSISQTGWGQTGKGEFCPTPGECKDQKAQVK